MSADATNSAGSTLPTDPAITNTTTENLPFSLITINVTNITKLSTTNYLTWSLQLRSLLQGYDLQDYLEPENNVSPTITEESVVKPNPAYPNWFRQDKLIFSALLGSISVSCQALIARAASTSEAWTILAFTYGRSSRGHIKQIKDNITFLSDCWRNIVLRLQVILKIISLEERSKLQTPCKVDPAEFVASADMVDAGKKKEMEKEKKKRVDRLLWL
ncbi:PREDICTED: uncharacterized protein LOC104822764 [Tarenaya hassleriana]|uniref:uncharacterized protein LOC104822764 n=1 Tax=Tarenaya hassleriana TaxID=28532 RepID=UPI00053C2767|nr:PREDICTED: uncharacterized protein LOC104822764 [Tarenaya hassleriana]